MKKVAALKILNPVLGILLVSQLATGALHSRIPHEVFEIVHGGGGILLAAGVGLHLILNWSWIKANFLRKQGG